MPLFSFEILRASGAPLHLTPVWLAHANLQSLHVLGFFCTAAARYAGKPPSPLFSYNFHHHWEIDWFLFI